MRFVKFGLIVVLGVAASSLPANAAKSIKVTRHNLSNWGLYAVKAGNTGDPRETEVCIFCHAPHNADSAEVPLWGHKDTAQTGFQMASSNYVTPDGSAKGDSQPTGISKKCLSCHDGTVAIGALATGTDITMAASGSLNADGTLKSSAKGYIGTNLSSQHVISFKYTNLFPNNSSFAKLKSWDSIAAADQKSMFDRDGKMQCHSCHDPHTDWCDDPAKTVGNDPLWRKKCDGPAKNSSVCEVCHKTTFSGYTYEWKYGP